MKKNLLIIAVLFLAFHGFSQGIAFETGTWKEVLEKAKQTNKPIFVDAYATWCGPCKMMSKDIFPLAEVGAVYNANFICYEIDAEKGEGIEFAKKYEVRAYPTYLFIKSDGTLFFTALGSMEASNFIALSKSALDELNDPKPLASWEKEYAEKKNDPAFLLGYINKRSKLGKSNVTLIDDYLKLLPEEERTSDAVTELYQKEGYYLKVNSLAYSNLQKNRTKFLNKLFGNTDVFLSQSIINTMREAAKSKNETLLATAISAYDQLPQNSVLIQKDEIYMQYYQRTKENDKYLTHATNFCDNYLMKIPLDSIGNKISGSLNTVAWQVFELTSDEKMLKDALRWSKRSQEISPDNAMLLDTYANLLYKLGQKEEAIATEEKALQFGDKDDKEGFEQTLAKMRAGEKTWK